MLSDERWLPAPGFDGYEVSDHGRVRSWRTPAPGRRRATPLILRPCVRPHGHLQIAPCRDGRNVSVYVHRLVLEAFVGPAPEGTEGCHNDGNAANNRLDNLRWDTHTENNRDRQRHGTDNSHERNGQAILTLEQVREIRAAYDAGGITMRALGAAYGVSSGAIRSVVRVKTWRDDAAAVSP
jgi:hypothetical protein